MPRDRCRFAARLMLGGAGRRAFPLDRGPPNRIGSFIRLGARALGWRARRGERAAQFAAH
jgi:hypothetical protein